MATTLLNHNVRPYADLEAMLSTSHKAMVVAATGAGKTSVAVKYLEDHNLQGLVVCPKVSICKQWDSVSDNVATMTYQKFCNEPDVSAYDCYIFDEAHHTGASKWGKAVKTLMDSTTKPVIGLTADPKRYLDGGRDMGGQHLARNADCYKANLLCFLQRIFYAMDSIFLKFMVEFDSKAGDTMIKKATKKSPSGVHRITYHSHNCTLSFAGFPDIPMPGKIEHEKELLYAPTATVMFDKEISAWQLNMLLPPFPVCPENWSRIKSATEDMLAFWEEVRGELSDDGQWWSEAEAPPPKAERRK